MTDLRAQVLVAMKRAKSLGKDALSPSMVCDYGPPGQRLEYGAVVAELSRMWEEGLVDHARIGIGRYCLAPPKYVAPAEQMTLGGEG